jgi:hypothetical protein
VVVNKYGEEWGEEGQIRGLRCIKDEESRVKREGR